MSVSVREIALELAKLHGLYTNDLESTEPEKVLLEIRRRHLMDKNEIDALIAECYRENSAA